MEIPKVRYNVYMPMYQITIPDLKTLLLIEAETIDQAVEQARLEHGETISGDIEQIEN
jgi:hypothetical protein